jgi:hypothetical protein
MAGKTLPAATPLVWISADQGITKDGSSLVSQWDDLSENGRDFTQAIGGCQPTYVESALNGYPAIQFGPGKYMLNGDFGTLYGPITFIAVFKHTGGDAFMFGDTYAKMMHNESGGIRMSGLTTGPTSDAVDFSSYRLVVGLFSGADSCFTVNGGSSVTGNTTGEIISSSVNISGPASTGALFICEFMAYGAILTATESAAIKATLNAKYAIY